MKPILQQVKYDIISLLNSWVSFHSIASRVGVSKSSINRIRLECNVNRPLRTGGRPAKLSPVAKRRMVRMITSGEVDTTAQATRILSMDRETEAGCQTVRRVLKEAGLRPIIKKK